jgi:hypothetical protein
MKEMSTKYVIEIVAMAAASQAVFFNVTPGIYHRPRNAAP